MRHRALMRYACTSLLLLLIGTGGLLSFRAQQPPVPAQRYEIAIRDFAFDPPQLRVAPGDTVVWINHDIVPHTATETNKGWDSGPLREAASWYLVVQERGLYEYYCRFHPTMTGSFRVE